jgi:pyruvate carboxylase
MDMDLKGKKLLILGGSSTEIEIVNAAKNMGIYTIVTDYYTDWTKAPAKYVADEAWDVSWSDIGSLVRLCKENDIDGCITGFSEKKVQCAKDLCSRMNYSFYAHESDLDTICDKMKFKDACIKSGVTVPKTYKYGEKIVYPVIVKPADNGGSRGITICHSEHDLDEAYKKALQNSDSERVLIEQYIDADEVMVFYNIYDGHCVLSAMCDRIMQRFDSKITQLPVGYYYPSKYLHLFLQHGDEKYRRLIKNLGILNGTIAFQSFVLKDDFLPFDPTYRLDGTMTYRLTEHLNNINVLEMLIRFSLTGVMNDDHAIALKEKPNIDKIGFQLPILLTRGRVSKVVGMGNIEAMDTVFFIHTRMKVGDVCDKLADFSQIFCRIHMCVDDHNQLIESIERVYSIFDVVDQNGNSMVIGRLDTNQWKGRCR